MNRAISSYSDTSSIDEETLLQQELARLQRQYRVMENERKEVRSTQFGSVVTSECLEDIECTSSQRHPGNSNYPAGKGAKRA